jgi:archaemetzincin
VVRLEIVRVGLLAPKLLEEVSGHLKRSGVVEIKDSEMIISPELSFDPLRRQYRVDTLIEMMHNSVNSGNGKAVGLTEVDIFLPLFTHLYGYAPLSGKFGIVSVNRLKVEDELPLKEKTRLLSSRGAKEILHELGHLLGLRHCIVPWCVMRPSMEPEEIDAKDLSYCEICLNLIKEKNR